MCVNQKYLLLLCCQVQNFRGEFGSGLTFFFVSFYSINFTEYSMQWWIQDFEDSCANPNGGGTKLLFWPIFPQNGMHMKEIGLGGEEGARPSHPAPAP